MKQIAWALCVVCLFLSATAVAETPCQSAATCSPPTGNSGPSDFYNVGYKFTVKAGANVQVTKLWMNIHQNITTTVRLYAMDTTVLASANFASTADTWVSADITPVQLTAETSYVVAVWTSNYNYTDTTYPIDATSVTLNEGRYIGTSEVFPASNTTTRAYTADITLEPVSDATATPTSTPTPTTGPPTATPTAVPMAATDCCEFPDGRSSCDSPCPNPGVVINNAACVTAP